VELGYQHFIDGEYDAALTAEQKALAIYQTAPGSLAGQEPLRDLEYKALLVGARSAEVLGRGDDSSALMAEAVRAFPERPPPSSQFDPKVGALYRNVAQEITRGGSGSLDVRVDDAGVVIFVDERYVGVGHAKLDNLAPGRYRIYVSKEDRPGRVREIDVTAGGTATVEVSWVLDGALRNANGHVEVRETDDEHVAAIQLARALGASEVVVLTQRKLNGRRAVAGYAIEVDTQHRTFAAVQVEPTPPSLDTMRRIGALLAGEHGVSDSDLITQEPPKPTGPTHLGARRKWALGTGALGVAALIAAGGFELSSRSTYDASKLEGNNDKQNALYDSANRKYQIAQGFAIGGAVCVAAAAALWFTGRYETEPAAVSVAPVVTGDGVSFVVAGRF
jgi:hypothetical protein